MEKFIAPENKFREIKTKEDDVDCVENKIQEMVLGFIENPNINSGFLTKLEKLKPNYGDYEKMIPAIERACLKGIPLLEKCQLAIRGDCLSSKNLKDYPGKNVISCERNQRARLDNKTELALYGLMRVLWQRSFTAYRYFDDGFDYFGTTAKQRKPTILYGFRSFNKGDDFVDIRSFTQTSTYDDFFVGQGDDIGIATENIKYLLLPFTGEKTKNSGRKNRDLFFPIRQLEKELSSGRGDEGYQKIYNISQDELSLTKKRFGAGIDLIKKRPNEYFSIEIELPKTYFNLLALAKNILTDIENYDKSIRKE
ncbi:hypothetical protein FJ208_00590 [Candidatus Gribaldobacteria bacterium]|nr:hypothetical protein [Candidatus Gribaldobacteria bacterium]